MKLYVHEVAQKGSGNAHQKLNQQIPQNHAGQGAHDALDESLGQNDTCDHASRSAYCSQHTNIAAAFGDERAEGVEDDECTHEEGQRADHVEGILGNLQRAKDLRCAAQRAQLVFAAQALGYGLFDGGAFFFSSGVEIRFHRTELVFHVQQTLRDGHGYQHFFVARGHARGQNAHNFKAGQALGGGQLQTIAELQAQCISHGSGNEADPSIAFLQEAALIHQVGANLRSEGGVQTDHSEDADLILLRGVLVEEIGG